MGPWAIALTLALATDVLAQAAASRPAVALAEDMRLWSFGDCDRRFPYVDTNEHQECVRAVGSAEARDARALKVCEVSHQSDREEAQRCMDTYKSNKEKAARNFAGTVGPEVSLATPSPEVMRRVKAITSAAVEERQAGAPAAPPTANAQSQGAPASSAEAASSSSSAPTIAFVLLAVILVGIGATVVRKKQAQSA